MAALSRTERLTTPEPANPAQPSPTTGPIGLRPRLAFSPNSPQREAGIRIEPPPSVACAIGRIPADTAAAAPPDEPPGDLLRSQGLQVGPFASGSVVQTSPSSGVLVRPNVTRPASRHRTV
jgi:hypothetical protein